MQVGCESHNGKTEIKANIYNKFAPLSTRNKVIPLIFIK